MLFVLIIIMLIIIIIIRVGGIMITIMSMKSLVDAQFPFLKFERA